ncbi:MAG TPA: ATP-binding protein [Terriglobia bacterium]|nr:ATP-binding protein [Terriglobia bacterium]
MIVAEIEAPKSMQDLGIRRSLIEDLALKILYYEGELTLLELSRKICLSFNIVEQIFERLRKEMLCEVKGMTGTVHRIAITSTGRHRALELLMLNHYYGPAPVSLSDYVARIHAQSIRNAEVRPPQVQRAFSHLVLPEETLNQLGTAVVSGRCIILYGPAGTGKTAMAESIPKIYGDRVWVPYAVEVDGQIITVYDQHLHQRFEKEEEALGEYDKRWVLCSRPRVVVGGELTLEMLDLQMNPLTKFYSAPLQMKANNGVLVVDDFGRQRMRPEDMLNRWIVPLDRRIDFLNLAGGKQIEIPFDLFVAFATNLDPRSFGDEAFLRRIQTKIKVDYVPPGQFHEIFKRVCDQYDLEYDATVVDGVLSLLAALQQPLRACYPRDIVQHICWAAKYQGIQPKLDGPSVRQACRNYFLES